jgi:hypothetical protein
MRMVDGKEVAEDGDVIKVARDGQAVRVPLTMMDRHTPSAAPTIGHKPGFLAMNDADRAALDVANVVRDNRLSEAWRTPPSVEAALVAMQTAPAASAVITSDERYTARDKRLEDAWRFA